MRPDEAIYVARPLAHGVQAASFFPIWSLPADAELGAQAYDAYARKTAMLVPFVKL